MSDTITIEDDETGRVKAIIKRASVGDTSVLPELREVLDNNPALWRHLGNLATQTERVWIDLITSNHLVASESLRRFIAALKLELVGPDPSPVLRLQSEQVAISWLQLHHVDLLLADLSQYKGGSMRQLDSATRRKERVARAHQRALALLETVKRLMPVPQSPDGDGSPRAADPPTADTPEEGADVLPMPSDQSDRDDPARRIAAQIRSENQSEPMRRAQ